ncbi:hypothetical protein ATG_16600 [Desulfurococcaceae archaeon AG1]|nr:hypothetical protein ATG_16600 [Desulfurococcaceae archaeon AG1]
MLHGFSGFEPIIVIARGAVSFLCRCRGCYPRPLRGSGAAGRAVFPREYPVGPVEAAQFIMVLDIFYTSEHEQ